MKTIVLILFITFNFNIVNAESEIGLQSKIFKNIRCLICQGQSVADSNSEFAQTVKLVVRDQISNGKSEKEIYNFLIEKYGEWIVYKPPFNTNNLILWLLPYFVLVSGGVIIFLLFKKKVK
jgi:cytochrome c-type biogenesis protein CcmH